MNSINALTELQNCKICPRDCGVDRTSGATGFCGQSASITAARAYLHAWEEPCISGQNGSGTVFFSGCNMKCVFCQNSEISTGDVQKEISSERLSEIFLELQDKKASNINLVTPTHFVPLIIPALERAKAEGLRIPVVYNSSGYEKVSTLKFLDGLIDIYLPDCKYFSDELAIRYSSAPGYFNISMDAIAEMLRQVGKPKFLLNSDAYKSQINIDASQININESQTNIDTSQTNTSESRTIIGADKYNDLMEDCDDDYSGPLMISGVIVRHLMLPGQLADSEKVLGALLDRFGSQIYLSIMNQFTPHGDLTRFPELLNPVNEAEYDALIDFCIDHGIENGFFQGGGTDSESFIPAFDFYGL